MLLTKWITGDINDYEVFRKKTLLPFLCLYLFYSSDYIKKLLLFAQTMTSEEKFSVTLSVNSISFEDNNNTVAYDLLMTLFFQPSFYIVNNSPVIFVKETDKIASNITDRLREKCILQGFSDLTIFYINDSQQYNSLSERLTAYYTNESDIDLNAILEKNIQQYLKGRQSLSVHLLVNAYTIEDKIQTFEALQQQEESLKKTRTYLIANKMYELQEVFHQLTKKTQQQKTNEDNLQLYLQLQKKSFADDLDWYRNEYEILPLWYKRVGQVIKVIMGKRSFRSLFSDNVKKYKN